MEVEGKIQEILKALPETPGVYRFYDEKQSLLYVGKAKNLKHRVSSYFHKQHHDSGRIRLMVKLVRDIQIMVVETELDALLLENNLIKEQKPRFNVMLRDDKTYPWICITNEPFPRVFPTRRKLNEQDEYSNGA
jgi:excinuclease ABC subunit C